MEIAKKNSAFFVVEGFVVLVLAHICGGYVASTLIEKGSNIPPLSLYIIFTSALSPVVAIIYLVFRTHIILPILISSNIFKATIAGVIFMWLVAFIQIIFIGRDMYLSPKLLEVSHPFDYINIFLCVCWAPLVEEALFRGYFLNMLMRKWGLWIAILASSTLFVVAHLLFAPGTSNTINMALLFTRSIIVSFAFIQGGFIAAVLVHSFNNLYFLIFN